MTPEPRLQSHDSGVLAPAHWRRAREPDQDEKTIETWILPLMRGVSSETLSP